MLMTRWGLGTLLGMVATASMAAACSGEREIDNCRNPSCCDGNCSQGGAGGAGGGGAGDIEQLLLEDYGDDSVQFGTSVAFDADGNFYVAGYFQGTFPVEMEELTTSTNADMFLIRFLADGSVDWAKSFGQTRGFFTGSAAIEVAVASDNNPIIASAVEGATTLDATNVLQQVGMDPDLFIAKLDATTGESIWYSQFADSAVNAVIRDIDTDAAGNVYFTGEVQGTAVNLPVGTTSASFSGFVVKLDADGVGQWSGEVKAGSGVRSLGVSVADDGNVAVVGSFLGTVEVEGSGMLVANGNEFPDAFAVLYDPTGQAIRLARWGDGANQEASSVDFDQSGNMVIGGRNSGTLDLDGGISLVVSGATDGFVMEVDPEMNVLWALPVEGQDGKLVTRVAVGADDQVVATGHFETSLNIGNIDTASEGNRDIFVFSLDDDGALSWARFFGGIGNQDAYGVAVANDGQVAFTGAMAQGQVTAGGVTITNEGPGENIIVGLLAP
jgi:hypothetical protein